MYNYFQEVTYTTLEMPSWFFPVPDGPDVISYQDIYARGYYLPFEFPGNLEGYWDEYQKAQREHELIKRACEYVEDEVPDELDLDNNGDGYIDNMVFVIRGEPSAWGTLLWPHRWVLFEETAFINGVLP